MELFSSAGLEDCDRGHAKEEGEEKKKKSVVVVCVCARALRNRKLPRAVAAALPSVNSNQ